MTDTPEAIASRQNAGRALRALEAFDSLVEGFIKSHSMRVDVFGVGAAGSPDFVHRMRKGKNFTRSTMHRVLSFMAEPGRQSA